MRTKHQTGSHKMKRVIASLVVSVSFGMAVPSAHAYYCPPYEENIVVENLTVIEVAIKGLMKLLFNNMMKMLYSYDKEQLGAQKVLTSQIAMSSRAQINAKLQLTKARVNALGYLEASQQQLRVFQDYSPKTGQGVDPCGQLNAQTLVTVANRISTNTARSLREAAWARPGSFGDTGAFNEFVIKRRQEKFGTKDDEALGFGKRTTKTVKTVTGKEFSLESADTNAGVLFADADDADLLEAKKAFITNVAGAPDAPVTGAALATPAGKQYLVDKGRKDAALSAALYSLAKVGGEHTPSPDSGGKSSSQAMNDLVGTYYGDGAKDRWKSWMSQSNRGLQMDMMKIEAAQLAAKRDEYLSFQRTELMLGTLVLLSADEYREDLDDKLARLGQERNKSGVR